MISDIEYLVMCKCIYQNCISLQVMSKVTNLNHVLLVHETFYVPLLAPARIENLVHDIRHSPTHPFPRTS